MKKVYKLINDSRYLKPCNFIEGVILKEDDQLIHNGSNYESVAFYVFHYPEDWKLINDTLEEYFTNLFNDEDIVINIIAIDEAIILLKLLNLLKYKIKGNTWAWIMAGINTHNINTCYCIALERFNDINEFKRQDRKIIKFSDIISEIKNN